MRVAFVCVRNAGRSQMCAAFAERERVARGLDDAVEILSGGTHPAAAVHETVIEAMAEVGIDLANRSPREITDAELESCDVVATMGCSTLELDDVDTRDWDIPNPAGEDVATVRTIRNACQERVVSLFDDLDERLA